MSQWFQYTYAIRRQSVSAETPEPLPTSKCACASGIEDRIQLYWLTRMPLAEGTHVGPYRIMALLGAGGMGTVYRATDTRLGRTVAIKMISESIAGDSERRLRFKREAQAVAALHHPHICTLFDVVEQSGTDFLVMEYVDGMPLSQRLADGALPVDEALRLSIQILDALGHAHHHGIVHRDLKPGNIMVAKSGLKLLDFGLAKTDLKREDSDSTLTFSEPLTAPHAVLGTPHYMAPEQLRGRPIDARADIFSFGAVLYEMLTGRRAFEADSNAGVAAAILERDPPPVSTQRPEVPRSIETVVDQCLAKQPDERWQCAKDLKRHLELLESAQSSGGVRALKTRAAWRRWLVLLCAGIVAALTITWAAIFSNWRSVDRRTATFSMLPAAATRLRLQENTSAAAALDPTGDKVAFVAHSSGMPGLWLRSFSEPVPKRLSGTEGASHPFWSPDGRSLGFFADGKLKRTEVSGGFPRVLCDAPIGRGGSWRSDKVIVFTGNVGQAVTWVSAEGGTPRPVTMLNTARKEQAHIWPELLSDGKQLLYVARSADPDMVGVYLASIDDSVTAQQTTLLVRTPLRAQPIIVGGRPHLLYINGDGALVSQALDLSERKLIGNAVVIANDVSHSVGTSFAEFSSSERALVYAPANVESGTLVQTSRAGAVLWSHDQSARSPRFSPDGILIAFGTGDSRTVQSAVWVMEQARRTARPIATNAMFPIWSGDGQHIAYAGRRGSTWAICSRRADGNGPEEVLFRSSEFALPTDWSRDGKWLAFWQIKPETRGDVFVLSVANREVARQIAGPGSERDAQFSPDRAWIAYTSNETGQNEIYVQGFGSAGPRFQVSMNGGAFARWRNDSSELYYLAPSGAIMSLELRFRSGALRSGTPQLLMNLDAAGVPDFSSYDSSPDGTRFVSTMDKTSMSLRVLINWYGR